MQCDSFLSYISVTTLLLGPTNDNSDKELTRERRSTNQNAAEKFVEIIIFHDYEYYEKYGLSEEEVYHSDILHSIQFPIFVG